MVEALVTRLALALVAILLPRLALACACCSDPGSRYERAETSIPLDAAILQLGTNAQIVSSEAGTSLLDPILGEGGADALAVTTKVDPRSVVITLRSGKTFGTLVFKAAGGGSSVGLDVDPFDAEPNGAVPIYHENRYPLTFRGTGTLSGAAGAAVLVLQGHSNACPPERFATWHLTLDPKNGESAQLYGRTKR